MRVVAVVQARLGSTRFPAKVLADLGGRSVLEWVIRATSAARLVDEVVVATTTQSPDDAIVAEAARLGVACVRGSEDDVLSRYVLALDSHPCDAVVRITSDCPLLDPELIDIVVAAWRAQPHRDYVSTVVHRTLPHGLDVEIVRAEALRTVMAQADSYHRVHVTSGIYTRPGDYDVMGLVFSPDATDLRVTVDTVEDLQAVRAMVAELGDAPPARSRLIGLLRDRPDIAAINSHIAQKGLAEG